MIEVRKGISSSNDADGDEEDDGDSDDDSDTNNEGEGSNDGTGAKDVNQGTRTSSIAELDPNFRTWLKKS